MHILRLFISGGPTPATQTAPVTFPPMACEPPTSDFITETRHVFVIPNYKESLELLEDTLRILATHPGCQERCFTSFRNCVW